MSRTVIAILQPLSLNKSLVVLHINQREVCAETIARVGFCKLFCQYLTGFVYLRPKACGATVGIRYLIHRKRVIFSPVVIVSF
jgi:hypothetical protein